MPENRKRLAQGHLSSSQVQPAGRSQSEPDRSSRERFPIVGIGASAGGLDAVGKLLDALPAACGMAFILVQHLDPNHDSMLVELLASHTTLDVRQAADGMAIEPDHLYVIPPGSYRVLDGLSGCVQGC